MDRNLIDKNKALLRAQEGMRWNNPNYKFLEGNIKERTQSLYEYLKENTFMGKLTVR